MKEALIKKNRGSGKKTHLDIGNVSNVQLAWKWIAKNEFGHRSMEAISTAERTNDSLSLRHIFVSESHKCMWKDDQKDGV